MECAEKKISDAVRCQGSESPGARVERLSMAGAGISRRLKVQPYGDAFACCRTCGSTRSTT